MEDEQKKLSNKQMAAIELVMHGVPDAEAAEQVGVSRRCVNNWRNQNELFQTELEKRRKEIREKHKDALSGLVMQAIEVLRDAMQMENAMVRLRAAQIVLRTAGLQSDMKAEAPASRNEIIVELLGEMIGKVNKEMGVGEVKQLGSGG